MVYILHDHVGNVPALLCVIGGPIHFKHTFRLLIQTAQTPGEGRFSRAVVSDNADDLPLGQDQVWNIHIEGAVLFIGELEPLDM